MYIDWKDDYCIGVTPIDDQHFRLIGMLNSLHGRIGPETVPASAWELLAGFNRYAETHFSTEERIARDSAVPLADLIAHLAEHEAYRDRMCVFQQSLAQDDRRAPAQLMAFLSNWWLSHILVRDMELGRLIRAGEVAQHG